MRNTNSRRPSSKAPQSRSFEVKENNTLLAFLLEVLKDQSKTTVKSLLAHKEVQICGRVTRQFDELLKPGDTVTIGLTRNAAPFSHSQLTMLYEDDHLIVVDKMSGLLSMGTESDKTRTAYRILSDYVKRKNTRGHVFILHRLDKDTSGVMMFAKSKEVQEVLQKEWNEVILERKYVAVVEGLPAQECGTLKSYISENKALVVHVSSARDGKLAITNYRVLKSNRQFSLVELELETGRKNQIRVHMQEMGHPIAGDDKYGAKSDPIRRLALHAFKLRFVHPVTRKEMNFETPFPAKFMRVF